MAQKRDLRDPVDRMYFREAMHTNWHQKKFRPFVKQLEEFYPYSDGEVDLLYGLCYLNGWGVRKNRETAQKYFSRLSIGQTVWFGSNVGFFMEFEVVSIQNDRVLLREENARGLPIGYGRSFVFPPKEAENAPWDCCLARKWMNTDYYHHHFEKHERDLILKVKISTPPNPFTEETVPVKEVTDKIFPLSIQEYMDYKGLTGKTATPITWTFTEEGPEAVCIRAGEYITRITTKEAAYNALYFGSNTDDLRDTKLGNTASLFRTAGSTAEKKAFAFNDIIFYEGEKGKKVKCSKTKLEYNPAFWVSLK